MTMRRRTSDRRIFFPWEGRRGIRRWVRLRRARPFFWGALAVGFLVLVGMRERRAAGIRQTRATLALARRAVDAYAADHDGGCPADLGAVIKYGSFTEVPSDAWGRPLRLDCPTEGSVAQYEIMSDGPDGEPGGLDRIE
jgi:general secretion pathway protein G